MQQPLPTIPVGVFQERRRRLVAALGKPILLSGNSPRARNLPANPLPFRQDSTFLYFTGCRAQGSLLLLHDGAEMLFVPDASADDELWHGPQPDPAVLKHIYGVDEVRPLSSVHEALQRLNPLTLAVADETRNSMLNALTGVRLEFGTQPGSLDLIEAVIAMRRIKDTTELEQLRAAAQLTYRAHLAVMRATRPGTHEQILATLFKSVIAATGSCLGYDTILTQRGEILHNFAYNDTLSSGRMLLVDGGAELPSGYGSDVTRTWPVSGTFSAQQRAAYDAVLQAQQEAIAQCKAGNSFLDVHQQACRVIARFLLDERLLQHTTVDEIVETGAHALFFPHGVGHLIGLDVHDMENFGDRPSYAKHSTRSAQFGTSFLRLNLPLEPNWVVTVEPGFYIVPAIFNDPELTQPFSRFLNRTQLATWENFGGIRIEDDILITDDQPDVLTNAIPRDPDRLEALIGNGPFPEDLFDPQD